MAANAELVRLYEDIGRIIDQRQQAEGWGAGVIPRLALELRNELPEVQGISERNIKRMVAFHRPYPQDEKFIPQAVAQISPTGEVLQAVAQSNSPPESILWSVSWGHHALLLEKVKTGNGAHPPPGKVLSPAVAGLRRARNPTDQPTIALILCQTKDRVLAEYALRGIDKPIGVSRYELCRPA